MSSPFRSPARSSAAAPSVDWGAGSYERTAAELEPVADEVVQRARLGVGDAVVDVACGTGNAALSAAGLGASVIGVDGAARLLEVARARAGALGLELDLRVGDLSALPVPDRAADVVLSVFGIIFASDPPAALGELRRVLRPSGRALISAWVPAGPIDAMIGAIGRLVGQLTGQARPPGFAWHDSVVLGAAATAAGLRLSATHQDELPIRARSPEAYVDAGSEHPMSLAVAPVIEQAGASEELRAQMLEALRAGNEDPEGFLVHSPYVIHELHPA